jgi:excisionase family DNA binding protein
MKRMFSYWPFTGPQTSLRSAIEFESLFEPLLDSDEAAQLLKIHPRTLQRMARRGAIPGVQIGRLGAVEDRN